MASLVVSILPRVEFGPNGHQVDIFKVLGPKSDSIGHKLAHIEAGFEITSFLH